MKDFWQVDFWEMILRSTLSFLVLLIFARLLGKKQLSQLTFFNYVTGITIGSIAADISAGSHRPFFNGLISLVWWSILTMLIGYLGLKSSKARILFDGQPTIVVREGKILKKALHRTQINLDDLSMMLREKNVFSIQEVHYAILEPDGQLSVLTKAHQQTVTKGDMNIPAPAFAYLPSEIISDGQIVKKNLKELNVTEEWIYETLRKQGVDSVEDVFYAEIQKDGSLFINKY